MVRKPDWLKSTHLPDGVESRLRRLEDEYQRVDGSIPVDCLTLIQLWEKRTGESIYLEFRPLPNMFGFMVRHIPSREEKRESPGINAYLMFINTNDPVVTQRITIVHELAHRLAPKGRYDHQKTLEFYCDLIAIRLLCPSPALGKILGKTWLSQRHQDELPLGGRKRTPEGETLVKTAKYLQVSLRDLLQYLKILYPKIHLRDIVAQFCQHPIH